MSTPRISSEPPGLPRALSRVLLVGLLTAVVLLVVGVILALVRPGVPVPARTSLVDLPRALAALEPGGFFTLGLLVLVATPVARVITMVFAFIRLKMWLFLGMAVLVLAVIFVSAYLGLRV